MNQRQLNQIQTIIREMFDVVYQNYFTSEYELAMKVGDMIRQKAPEYKDLRALRGAVFALRNENSPMMIQDVYSGLTENLSIYDPTSALDFSQLKLIAETIAKKNTEEVMQGFIKKQEMKYGDVIGQKGVKEYKLRGESLWSVSLKIVCDDGSRFDVDNKVVRKYSTRGLPFLQFPTTFHNVILADGTKMKQPSYDQMELLFPLSAEQLSNPAEVEKAKQEVERRREMRASMEREEVLARKTFTGIQFTADFQYNSPLRTPECHRMYFADAAELGEWIAENGIEDIDTIYCHLVSEEDTISVFNLYAQRGFKLFNGEKVKKITDQQSFYKRPVTEDAIKALNRDLAVAKTFKKIKLPEPRQAPQP